MERNPPLLESERVDYIEAVFVNSNVSLRDIFAAHALSGLIARNDGSPYEDSNRRTWAKRAYVIADALLDARAESE